jgi:proteasome lid subunit RPN8/RPN11
MAIEISVLDVEAIRSHGEETFPNECCGFMLGKANGDLRNVAELMRAENDREDEAKYNRFLITPDAFMRGEKAAREKGLDIIGFYHSHPDAPARPSKYDLDHAWPWYSYVIVSIKAGEADVMTSWVLREDRGAFGEEDIIELS